MSTQYQDFTAYTLDNDGTFSEIELEQSQVGEYLDPEEVLLLVKQDLRRLFIWKGPKSPVRKRFISSRAAAQIQEDVRNDGGRYLKIISVDAGDEPIEFLSTFNLEPYEVTEKLDDMKYLRNYEREKLKEEELKKKFAEKKKEKEGEYWSPLLEEMKKLEEDEENTSTQNESQPQKEQKQVLEKVRQKSAHSKHMSKPSKAESKPIISLSSKEQDNILKKVQLNPPPVNMKPMNIIIGQSIYGPSVSTSKVLGKIVETEKWDKVQPPTGIIDLETSMIRVFIDETTKNINAVEIFQKMDDNPTKNTTKKTTKDSSTIVKKPKVKSKKTTKSKKTARQLPKIPHKIS